MTRRSSSKKKTDQGAKATGAQTGAQTTFPGHEPEPADTVADGAPVDAAADFPPDEAKDTVADAAPAPESAKASTAIAKAEPAPASLVMTEEEDLGLSDEELAAVLEGDGLQEASAEDFRIGFWVCNVLNREVEGPDGKMIQTRRDQWWNTLSDRVEDSIQGVFVGYRKTNDFARFNSRTNQNERFCRSGDLKTGSAMRDFTYKSGNGTETTVAVQQGQQRPCVGCPQQQWHSVEDPQTGEKRNIRDCALVRNFVFYDAETNEPGVIRFKKSSAQPAIDMLSRYHLGKLRVMAPKLHPKTRLPMLGQDGKPERVSRWVNRPLYAFVYKISLALDKSGNFAVPEFKKVRALTGQELMSWKAQSDFIAGISQRVEEAADRQEAVVDAEGAPDGPDAPTAPAADDKGFDDDRVDAGAAPSDETF